MTRSTQHSHGPRVSFDDDLRTLAHAVEQRREVVRRFRFRDVDHFLGHTLIIHRVTAQHPFGASPDHPPDGSR